MSRKCRPDARLRALPLIPVLVLGLLAAARPAAAQDADHLILSEIVTTVNRVGARFIEIVNPTGDAVPLGDVYLTTGTYEPNAAGYWRLVEEQPGSATAGGGTGGTFHGRFPAGASLAAGDTLTVAVTGSSLFAAAYGFLPDFEVFEEGTVPDAVPELVEVFPGSIGAGALAGGTNPVTIGSVAGSVMLYRWDGVSALVEDLDYFGWTTNANRAYFVDKSGYSFGGATYLDDTPIADQTPLTTAAGDGRAYARGSADEGAETATGGNGATGHDETSENFPTTWSVVQPQAPAAPPAARVAAAPIFGGADVAPAAPYAGQATVVTVTVVSPSALTAVDVNYTVDGGAVQTAAASDAGEGDWTATIPAQAEGALVVWWAVATNADGAEATYPAAAPRFTGGWTVGTAPAPGELPRKLLITEVNAGVNFYPNYGGISDLGMEFIEFHNPGDEAVDLGDYYVTDVINYVSGANQVYWRIAETGPITYEQVGGGNYNDFHARFPDGYTIGAGQTIVLAIAGSDAFSAVYGVEPDLELYEDADVADAIPDMRPVFTVSVSPREDSIYTPGRSAGSDGLPRGIPELEEFYGEPVILYHWNEGDALVTDVDFFVFGEEKTGTYRVSFDKTGVTNLGETYEPDTPVAQQVWFTTTDTSGDKCYTRVASDDEDGNQVSTGGNGVDGRDETSEDLVATFEILNPTPGVYLAGDVGEAGVVLKVPARTFLPGLGERFRIEFTGLPASEVRLRIFDLDGRLVTTLWDSRFDGDPSTLPAFPQGVTWDGRDDTYERVPAGMYVLHLSVVDERTGDEETRTAPVVVATRLSK